MNDPPDDSLGPLIPVDLAKRFTSTGCLIATLRNHHREGLRRWSRIDLSFPSFLDAVIPRVRDAPHIEKLSWMDLFLCASCELGEPEGLITLEREYIPSVGLSLRRTGLAEEQVTEVLQQLREKIFTTTTNGSSRLREYSGRSKLTRWLYVIAVRIEHNNRRAESRRDVRDGMAMASLVDALPNPELKIIKTWQRTQVQQIIERSIRALEGETRQLLRLHFVEELSIDRLSLLYNVHRATVARRITQAVHALRGVVQQLAMEELGLNLLEYQSLLRFVRSQMEVNLKACLE